MSRFERLNYASHDVEGARGLSLRPKTLRTLEGKARSTQGPLELGVYDMIGNEVQRQVINRQSADAVFTIQHDLAPGLYIIQLSQGEVTRSVRWVVR